MSHAKLAHIRAVIFDLDGTLYQYGEDFHQACSVAAARTVMKMGFALGEAEAIRLAYESQINHGSSFYLFKAHGLQYRDFHEPYHAEVDISSLVANPEITAALQGLDMPMAILTNASRVWANRVMKHVNIFHIFGDGKIICLEDNDFISKSQGPDGFIKVLDLLGVPPHQVLMVEDLAANLTHAKKLGMTTALVHARAIPAGMETAVDYVYEKIVDLVRDLPHQDPVPTYSSVPASP